MRKNFKKRFLSAFISTAMIFTMLPVMPLAVGIGELAINEPYITAFSDEDGGNAYDEILGNSTDVSSADELETALSEGKSAIRITNNFEISRTFYVTGDTVIYSDAAHTLTRSTTFAGDIFVVGEDVDGNECSEQATLVLGNPNSNVQHLLTIDGNADNMTVDVVGSVIFVCGNGKADLHKNLTVTNAKKVDNERALDEKHGLSNTKYVGGAVAVLAKNSAMDIYGGTYSNNSVNTTGNSVYGGAFFNFSTLNVYGGLFENNSALRAAVFYNYRTLRIYRATIRNNTASLGGAIYVPASTGAFLYLGGENEVVESSVTFSGNTAKSGGAISSSGRTYIEDTVFEGNSATANGGAIYGSGSYNVLEISNTTFKGNSATELGGAVYTTGQTAYEVKDLTVTNTVFTENTSVSNGGGLYIAEGAEAYIKDSTFSKNNSDLNGGAIYSTAGNIELDGVKLSDNISNYHGGAVVLTEGSTAVMNNITASGNRAKNNGGAIYSTASTLDLYNSKLESNTASAGSAMYLYTSATTNIYKTAFIENYCAETTTGNAGALMIYTGGTDALLHSCTFTDNTSNGYGGAMLISGKSNVTIYNLTAIGNSAAKGGVIYETTAGTVLNISGMTVSGNTATAGGPIIWGNTANAKLYINKTNYKDLDISGELDDNYWATAIVNKLTVGDNTDSIPSYIDYGNENIGDLWKSVDVRSASELENALASGEPYIRIAGNFEIDRTFYITANTTVFSTTKFELTRAAGFTGDIFVVGKTSDGTDCTEKVTLTLGNKISNTKNLLVINGNRENMTRDFSGTVIYVAANGQADIYNNLTFKNAEKPDTDSKGAVIYNEGTLNINGAIFENNSADNGGAVYNDSIMNVDATAFNKNTSTAGGAIYNTGVLTMQNATFNQNTSLNGGAVYVADGTVDCDNTSFNGNNADIGGAVAVYGGAYFAYRTVFDKNTAKTGGAVYTDKSYQEKPLNFTVTSCQFTNNSADNGGAIYAMSDGIDIATSDFNGNSADNGGAIALNSLKDAALRDLIAQNNSADADGGFLYVSESGFTMTGSEIKNNSADNGGAIALTNITSAKISGTDFTENISDSDGGAVYLSNNSNAVKFSDCDFISNNALNGGAIKADSSIFELNGVLLSQNIADYNGGAVSISNSDNVVMYNVTAEGNTSANGGGFLHTEDTEFKIYNSYVRNNVSNTNGGALLLDKGTVSGVYATEFTGNIAERNGGVAYVLASGTENTVQRCVFNSNTAENYGGVAYVSSKSIYNMYSNAVTGNKASKGAVLYITDAGTAVNVNEITVSGNTAEDSGIFAYGNSSDAVLNINKSNYTDTAVSDLTDDYWNLVIANKLKVNDTNEEIPEYIDRGNESVGDMADAVKVANSQELEEAINSGEKHIRVVADFEIDRTFYITSDVTIFSTSSYTLTRATDFGGDIFVVGEASDGTNSMIKNDDANLTLGNPASETENLLVFDGNKANMTVPNVGTVVFICNGAQANLYDNVSVINCYKSGNARTEEQDYDISRPNRVGGPVGIIISGMLNVYGGVYKDNEINIEDTSTEEGRNSTNGGVFYNQSNLRIYGGKFENNSGARGGIVYNYGGVKIFGGEFVSNTATRTGGIYYSPNSATNYLIIGSDSKNGEQVLFKNNKAEEYAGVIYSSTVNGLVIYGNTTFEGNAAVSQSGGAICVYGMLTARGTTFKDNTAKLRGGAIYVAYNSETYCARYVNVSDSIFENNSATVGGAVAVTAASTELTSGGYLTVKNCEFTENSAMPIGSSSASGGAIATDRNSELTVIECTFAGNTSEGEGGVIYTIGDTKTDVYGTMFENNAAKGHGGAISVRSGELNIDNSDFEGNATDKNGGVLYIAYSSAYEFNSDVKVTNSSFTSNSSASSGGVMYVTRRDIEGDTKVLTVRNTAFAQNTAKANGGALLLTGGTDTYLSDVTFLSNEVTDSDATGGAISVFGSSVEIDTAVFTRNNSNNVGGGVSLDSNAKAVMNNITATRNTASKFGGFMYATVAEYALYDSTMRSNSAVSGGAVYQIESVPCKIYNTEFKSNKANTGNGGALFIYTGACDTLIQGCTFDSNIADGGAGGGMYISGESNVELYKTEAVSNGATNGGFIYLTKAGTVMTVSDLTVSQNTATEGGPIIWGNTKNATLNIDKAKYTDLDTEGSLDENYWSMAIANAVTVNDISATVPEEDIYIPIPDEEEEEPEQEEKLPGSVQHIFDLAENSSDASINSTYDKLPKLDNSSNFMSKSTTDFENINGKTVTVDTFVYPTNGTADNMNVGEGLLIYQAMLYKKAHPEREVNIDIASYRFSVQAALNINRNSRYFGYMRDLQKADYDEYGFVRIAYLLVAAAKMGINVTVIGHQDAYPVYSGAKNFYDYFTSQLSDPCDPSYVNNGVVGDYLDFNFCYWTISAEGKGGTDMMHTKLCAVSDYVDMNGVEHENAIWTSSSNLDGIKSNATNANWKLQTGLIISNHEQMYRASVNYLRLIADYCYQEGIIEFQDIVNSRSEEQIDLILAGRGNEIPTDKQIVYIGTETDDVFELYFTPFGGGRLQWDEVHNPYCKYLRELYDSEDYILFTWNAAEYSAGFPLGQQMEEMIISAFHDNRNVKNKIYMNADTFDGTTFDDLTVGKDIGFKSFNEYGFGDIHNKDVQYSYQKDGQRYYVTLHNSCNMHAGSMYYQSNFALVIKEKTCADNSVFSTIARNSTKGDIVTHTYGEQEKTHQGSATEHGYKYYECTLCGDRKITGVTHHGGEWITDKEPSSSENGIRHKECVICGSLVETVETVFESEYTLDYDSITGKKFTSSSASRMPIEINSTPHTFEAMVMVPKDTSSRGGTIVGNYGAHTRRSINLEVYFGGKVRLFFINNGVKQDCLFQTDIRSKDPVHIAVTVDDEAKTATLYINGEKKEVNNLSMELPVSAEDYLVGGDWRAGNLQYFKGTIYSLNLFDDIRTEEEIKHDMIMVAGNTDSLQYSGYYTDEEKDVSVAGDSLGYSFTQAELYEIEETISQTPQTIEAIINVPKSLQESAGVIVGNYGEDSENAVSLEIDSEGKPHLLLLNEGTENDCAFSTDLRSDLPIHVAVTIDGNTAKLYVDGELAEAKDFAVSLPDTTDNYCIGGDYRTDNPKYFRGTIYSVKMYGDARSEDQIREDMISITSKASSLLYSTYFTSDGISTDMNGQTFDMVVTGAVDCTLPEVPHTFEATVLLPKGTEGRGGTIISNYGKDSQNTISIEVYSNGRPRLFFLNGNVRKDCVFSTDIRSDEPTHIAITMDDETKNATLYVNGELKERRNLTRPLPASLMDFMIGGDHRDNNEQWFKGVIYSVNLFSDVRTKDEIKKDAIMVPKNTESLIYSAYYTRETENIANACDMHNESGIIIDKYTSDTGNGIIHTECKDCGKIITVGEMLSDFNGVLYRDYSSASGLSADKGYKITETLSDTPRTYEITMQLSPSISDRAGVLIGNYDGTANDQVNIEVYNNGNPRLWYKSNKTTYTNLFKTDIRSDKLTHLAITINGLTASLYVNGELKETAVLTAAVPALCEKFVIGADNRKGEPQNFKGKIYSVNLFDDVRTHEEIAYDAIAVTSDAQGLIFSKYFLD